MRDSSNLRVDPLSDLLDFLQARCELSGRVVAGGTWARRFANLNAIKFCAVTEGNCWYSSDGMSEPARVDVGDVLITNGTHTLTLASTVALIPDATTTPIVRDSNDQYQLGEGCDFTMLGGTVQIDADRQALLLAGLPPLIHVRGTTDEAKPLAWLLEQLVAEMKSVRPGRSAVISGLAQLLFTQALRAYLAHASDGDEGWLKGFGDQKLAIVLSSIHSEPSRNWGLEELAKKAGMSRTSLAVRFREMMGIPPLAYLTQWRMYLARRKLRAGASISEAATSVGYTSDSAFSTAFKRVMAVAPGQYRRAMHGEGEATQTKSKADILEF
ncbi:AraC family transcriptional regulator [Oleiagrimonas soli]|uniref:AraC family transcriptional regulator n=1 Tax=Oleiagrimonas soli TaxID=1543381 RepID=A0A099CYZ4_9GAMM|nr:AraC family transcriptional regulator [Oleiagrimonas soli]KGI78250.1 AraC family transcriptional regulator [Oleiagrimonas soli]MBB6183275.1 AraC-like DNA-binding protein [Oleiagrimonas soli]